MDARKDVGCFGLGCDCCRVFLIVLPCLPVMLACGVINGIFRLLTCSWRVDVDRQDEGNGFVRVNQTRHWFCCIPAGESFLVPAPPKPQMHVMHKV